MSQLSGPRLWGGAMVLVGMVGVVLFGLDLIGYAMSGDITFISRKFGVVASGMAAVVMNISLLATSILVGVLGCRKLSRG